MRDNGRRARMELALINGKMTVPEIMGKFDIAIETTRWYLKTWKEIGILRSEPIPERSPDKKGLPGKRYWIELE